MTRGKTAPTALSILTVLCCAAWLPAAAGEGRVGITLKAGTLGLGADVSIRVVPRINVRVTGQQYSLGRTDAISGVDYRTTLELESYGALLDVHPFKGRFRLTAGLLANGNQIETVARLQPADLYTIGNSTYTGAQLGDLRGIIDFDSTTPYAGLGWGNPFGKSGRFSFSTDFGVVDQGIPEVRLVASNPLGLPIQQDLSLESLAVQNDVDSIRYYPVLSFGLTIRF